MLFKNSRICFLLVAMVLVFLMACVHKNVAVSETTEKKEDIPAKAMEPICLSTIGLGLATLGEGSEDLDMVVRKQKAFVSAFLNGVRDIFHKIDPGRASRMNIQIRSEIKNDFDKSIFFSKVNAQGRSGELVMLSSQVSMQNAELPKDYHEFSYKGQKIIVDEGKLKTPADVWSLCFPVWNGPFPKEFNGFRVEAVNFSLDGEELLCEVSLLYPLAHDGLIINAPELDFKSITVPRIIAENGEILFPGNLELAVLLKRGIGSYTDSVEKAESLLNSYGSYNPIHIKGVKTNESGADIIIGTDEAMKILIANMYTDFLSKGKVVWVINPGR